ncbi:MAG TPA: hypothetical protein VGE74_25400 [Gemmata sp.]
MSNDRPAPDGDLDRPHKKSRLVGGLLVALGALMTVVVFSDQLDREGGRIRALVILLAAAGTWVGLGLLLFPWTNRMVAGFTAENNAMIGFRKLPLLWKVWLVVALVLTVGTFAATLPPRR